jgi:hypothetical protein
MHQFGLGAALFGLLTGAGYAQLTGGAAHTRITRPVNEGQMSRLSGNTHPLAQVRFDRGAAPPDLPMQRMLLVLTRSSQQESALQDLLKAQQDLASASYHQWLTPQQFGERFGPAEQDVETVTAWLESHGFQIARVSNGRSMIEFSGSAAQVEEAFHTQIHNYFVNGISHWANASDPEIPSALAGVVAGVATLHNFRKKPQLIKANGTFQASPQFTTSNGSHALAPADYATIYNINPLYSSGIDGTGTVIAVVGRTNINLQDIASFRSAFDLPANPPQIVVNGPDPGDLGGDEEAEAVLDTSWAGTVAPGATVKLIVSESTNTSDGADLSELYIIDNNLADVMTESFGSCEASFTNAEAAAVASLAEQAAAQGITYTVAAGDSGAEGCDDPTQARATGPVSVNLLASTPYTVAVGGTQFNENGNNSAYWQAGNGAADKSALSYIPENVWNESCLAGQCSAGNSPALWAAGGGASTFFSKPGWQTGIAGIPNDNARDVPDVSLTAAGHDAYLLCLDGSCTPDSTGRISFDGYSGTSAATPSFAGIMALIVQKTGARQGQADYVLYGLAASEALSSCNASNSAAPPAANCIFNDVTSGNNAVPGERGYGTSAARYQATAGYDLATGLGSVNVANLVNNWNGVPIPSWEFHVGIDQPGVQQSTFIGLALFSGWAINSAAGISGVQISIDGVSYGNATYGAGRPDICNIYPGRDGCPNVGWSVPVDTTRLSDGTHTLTVLATSTLGSHAAGSSSFTVANWTTTDPMLMSIDIPGTNSGTFSGVAAFGGWAIDKTGAVTGVSVSIDGAPYGEAAYGGTRSDVCAIYAVTGCPNVGWNIAVDTRLLADGTHTLAITGITAAGQNTTVTKTFKTANLSGNSMLIDIDTPNSRGQSFDGPAQFGGWAFNNNAQISSVTVTVDGVFVGNASYGSARSDVCTRFPNKPGCPNVGWNLLFDTTSVANGSHTLEITATAVNGQRATAQASFAVANTINGAPLKMSIDQPLAQNAIVVGSTLFAGWAIDDSGPISEVTIAVDGVPRGSATYGGSRPDVCAVFPSRAGCPNVGWAFWLDTTRIANGPHTLAVTGKSANGDQLTLSAALTIANWTGANPMTIDIDTPNSHSSPFSGSVGFGGWVISSIAAIERVSAAIDGVPAGNANYGASRPDVCRVFSGRAGCPNVGWNLAIDTTLLANGPHTLAVTATSSGGQSSTATATFSVSNSGPIIVDIDQPNPNSGIVSGTAAFGGWTLDTNGVAIQTVKVLVDGVFIGLASYGGSRSDVCARFSSAGGCPDVGWNFLLDTTVLGNGTHTLEITAISTTGEQATAGNSFTVTQ